MVREIDPERSRRAAAFALWNRAPMPMVTLMKTLDVTRLVRLSRRRGYKINMLLCWCVGRAAARMEDFYLLPVGDKLMEYDRLAVNTVVVTRDGDIQTCDLPLVPDLEQFSRNYRRSAFSFSDMNCSRLPFHLMAASLSATGFPSA